VTEVAEMKRSTAQSSSFVYSFNPAGTYYGNTVSTEPKMQYYSSIPSYTLGTVALNQPPPLTPIDEAPPDHQTFAKQAQAIAAREMTQALTVKGYDANLNAVILDSGNWHFSMTTIRKIAAAAQFLGVNYQIRSPE
jgi:hypothetical protein